MLLILGPLSYRVAFKSGVLQAADGPVMAICDHARRELTISLSASPAELSLLVTESARRIAAHHTTARTDDCTGTWSLVCLSAAIESVSLQVMPVGLGSVCVDAANHTQKMLQ